MSNEKKIDDAELAEITGAGDSIRSSDGERADMQPGDLEDGVVTEEKGGGIKDLG